jgi:hypothetical protein
MPESSLSPKPELHPSSTFSTSLGLTTSLSHHNKTEMRTSPAYPNRTHFHARARLPPRQPCSSALRLQVPHGFLALFPQRRNSEFVYKVTTTYEHALYSASEILTLFPYNAQFFPLQRPSTSKLFPLDQVTHIEPISIANSMRSLASLPQSRL